MTVKPNNVIGNNFTQDRGTLQYFCFLFWSRSIKVMHETFNFGKKERYLPGPHCYTSG